MWFDKHPECYFAGFVLVPVLRTATTIWHMVNIIALSAVLPVLCHILGHDPLTWSPWQVHLTFVIQWMKTFKPSPPNFGSLPQANHFCIFLTTMNNSQFLKKQIFLIVPFHYWKPALPVLSHWATSIIQF